MTDTVSKGRKILHSLGGKVAAVLIAGAIAAGLSVLFTQVTFKKTLRTISDIVAPDQKLILLNRMLRNITEMEATHYTTGRSAGDTYLSYRARTQSMQHMLDTLSIMYGSDTSQGRQIDSIKTAMALRSKLVSKYIAAQSELIQNRELSRQIQSLSEMVDSGRAGKDGTIVTVEKKTTITTSPPEEKIRTSKAKAFFDRLFAKKKKGHNDAAGEKTVQEELSVKTDTIIDRQRDSVINEIRLAANNLGQYQRSKNNMVLSLEAQIDQADARLIGRLLELVRHAELSALNDVRSKQSQAEHLAGEGITLLNVIMLVFFLTILVLVVLIFTDIARSNRYRKELQAAKEEAEYLSQVKQRFLANMSHEIRTPLQSIIGFAEQAQAQQTPDKDYIRSIYKASEHLLHIVNEVLDYSRIVSGKFTFEPADFDIAQVMDEVSGAMMIEASLKGLDLSVRSNIEGTKMLHGDAFRIRQILYNLLGNAIKFTDTGSVSLELDCTDDHDGSLLTFRISDTGIGIAAEDIERIFNEFEQADIAVSRQRGGTGLGLTIVKALIDSQGGQIQIDSTPGKGSVFEVRLHLPHATDTAAAAISLPNAELSQKEGKVLVIDDDRFILQLCHVIMEKHHVPHECSSSPRAVAEGTWDEQIKAILVDIRMPEMSGIEFCHRLRQRFQDKIKIYALTAQTLPEEKEGVYSNEFDGVLMKPFREAEFMNLLKQAGVTDGYEVNNDYQTLKNFTQLTKITFNDPVLLQKILHQFIIETTSDLNQLMAYLTKNNTEQVIELLHRLAGRVGQIGAGELSGLIRQIETDLRQRYMDSSIKAEITLLAERLRELMASINKQLSYN